MPTLPIPALSLCLAIAAASPALLGQVDWTQLSPTTSPSNRTKGQLEYMLGSGSVLMFGGIDDTQVYLDETWSWDGTTWIQENPTNVPPGRIQSELTHDLGRGVVVMWSGYPGGNSYVQDLWEWMPTGGGPGNSGDWTLISSGAAAGWPQERDHMAMCYDLRGGRTLMFGGWNYFIGQVLYNDLWAWDGTSWTQIMPANTPPSGRDGHDMVLDFPNWKLVVFGGGRATSAALGDTWTYDLATDTWTQESPANSPAPRFNHSMVYDAARERVVLFGGRDATQSFSDVWEWDGANWTPRTTANMPSPRQYGRMAYDPILEHTVMFGGDLNASFGGGNNETWVLAPTTPATWSAFGAGCPGNNPTAATPNLVGGARPWLGDTGELIFSGLPTPTLAFLVAGFNNTTSRLGPLPLNLTPFGLTQNCFLLVDPFATVALTSSSGVARFLLPIAANPTLLGTRVYTQAAGTEGTGNFVISNAVEGTVGGR